MISKTDLKNLYEWAKDKDFPVRKTPTTTGYCNKEIFSFPLKFGRKKLTVRESMMPVEISDILKDEEILYTVYSIPKFLYTIVFPFILIGSSSIHNTSSSS